tara:strand:- start:240 stop:626 length:387 start_codon:yes stop_codon:yes gene_type:complete
MLGDITVETTIDLEDYRDEVLDAMQPDDIEDALEYLKEWWGFTEVDVLGCLLQDMDSDLLIEKLSECLDVSSALTLVERLHEYTISFSKQRENTKDNHIKDLEDKVDKLLAVCNHTVIKEAEEENHHV